MIETIVAIIAVSVPLVLTNQLLMSAIKWFMAGAASKTWLRGILALLSAVGVVVMSAYTGDAVDYNQVSDLVVTGLTILVTAVGSHFSYHAIKYS